MVEWLCEFPTDFAVRSGADLGDIHIQIVPFETASSSLRARVLVEGLDLWVPVRAPGLHVRSCRPCRRRTRPGNCAESRRSMSSIVQNLDLPSGS